MRAPSESLSTASGIPRMSRRSGRRLSMACTAMPTCAMRVRRRAGSGMGIALRSSGLASAKRYSFARRPAGHERFTRRMQRMSNALAVTDTNFEQEIEKHSGLAVVDFWATWCGPCRAIAPMLDQLATEYAGKAKVAKLDVDSNAKTAMRFNVRSIPTILFFKDGKLVDQVIGAVPKTQLETKFKQHAA